MSDYTGSNTPADQRDLWRTPPALFASLDAEFCFQLDAAAAPKKSSRPCARSQSLTGTKLCLQSSTSIIRKLKLWELASWSSSSKLAALTGGLEPNNEYEN